MKFLIVNMNYAGALRWLYSHEHGLTDQHYTKHMEAYLRWMPGTTFLYARNLRSLGHEVDVVVPNNAASQAAWLRDHGTPSGTPSRLSVSTNTLGARFRRLLPSPMRRVARRCFPTLAASHTGAGWLYDVLGQQIRYYKPDVLLNLAMDSINPRFVGEMKPYVNLTIGEGDAALPLTNDYRGYDIVRCSLPSHVDYFRHNGMISELYHFGFDPEILASIPNEARDVQVSFVGSVSPAHSMRRHLLQKVCEDVGLELWTADRKELPTNSPLRSCWRGEAYGTEAYSIMRRSLVTVNCHIDLAGEYADNMRLYEGTGLGAVVLTDEKRNLPELFVPGCEIVTYRTAAECVEKVRFLLSHGAERQAIAIAGQRRTLREHTYRNRMVTLVTMIETHLK